MWTLERFAPLVGEQFEMQVPELGAQSAALLEARPLRGTHPQGRQAFALLFQSSVQLPQSTYALSHPALGELALFLVPVARGSDGVQYEAIFN